MRRVPPDLRTDFVIIIIIVIVKIIMIIIMIIMIMIIIVMIIMIMMRGIPLDLGTDFATGRTV